MRDKLLAYALAVSVGVHLIIILCAAGRHTSDTQIHADDTPVQISVVRTPDEEPSHVKSPVPTAVSVPEPKPQTKPRTVQTPMQEPRFQQKPTPIRQVPIPVSVPRPAATVQQPTRIPFFQRLIFHNPPVKTASFKPAGNPGGALNTGSSSSRGTISVPTGRTPVGWVPGEVHGSGIGSGRGEGVGKPEPVHNAVDGPGREPAPSPPDVRIRICEESGMIPNPYCEHTVMRTYRAGAEPRSQCTIHIQQHRSTLADRSVPELISGPRRPKYPKSAKDDGIQGNVTVEYTVDTEGRATGIRVSSSSGNGDLDQAAIEAVQNRRYKPAVQAGIPRDYRKRETFRFSLE